jgi:hypothetical protein
MRVLDLYMMVLDLILRSAKRVSKDEATDPGPD